MVAHSTVISINGERMIWDYPDISFAQIHYLATGKWRQITPNLEITYKKIRTDGLAIEGTVNADETINVRFDCELKINTREI